MKAFAVRTGFGLDRLGFIDLPEPSAGPGRVLVRVRAASLNFRDLLLAKGQYNPRLKLPRVLGSDAAGEVVAVGEGVTRAKAGDRVAGCFLPSWIDGPITDAVAKPTYGSEIDGVLTELVAMPEAGAVPIPEGLSFVEAATLPCAGVTAWNALTGCGPGTTVLLQGTGGVSIFALQFAKALGARVLITSGHDDKLARAIELGADAGVNYRTNPDWDKWAREQTGGSGVDLVVEVGGAGTLERSAKAVKLGGHIALIGVLAGVGAFNPISVLMKAITVRGIFVGSRAMFEAMKETIVGKGIHPVVDRVFPFDQCAEAFRHLESGAHFGKVVVEIKN
ncbi:MAG TPA: NAD(P)-dependent alcohol dehydrogenase [Gemmataceae bacterium]|nr:NAD(P)-dependent alcohol dehydrogenase [Gemmataceae bacterium]